MSARPTFQLSRLREIGWEHWDPIGLRGSEGTADDEYDSYLLVAAARLWEGAKQADVSDYLVNIETEYMGLGDATGVRDRARAAVEALNSYVVEVRG